MDMIFPMFAVGVALVTTLVLIANARFRPFRVRLAALACAAALMTLGYTGSVEILGRAKPVSSEWAKRAVEEATVLASNLREGKAIYLWLEFDDSDGPKAYVLPWSKQAAKQLRNAQQRAKSMGTRVRVKRPFEKRLETSEPQFHAEARPALPEKTLARRDVPT